MRRHKAGIIVLISLAVVFGTSWIRSSNAPIIPAATAAATNGPARSVQGSPEHTIKTAIHTHTQGRYSPDEVRSTPIPGIYEVRVGLEVFYTDASGRYAFVENHLIDLAARQDLTQTRLDEIAAVKFESLPLNLAMKKVQGNGKRVVAIFEDPYCPICKTFHQFLAQLPDVTIYTFAYPILSAESDAVSKAAWCAPDRLAAWEDLIINGTVPASKPCANPIAQIVELGQRLHVRGTPTVIFGSGRRVHGAVPPDQFVAMLDAEVR